MRLTSFIIFVLISICSAYAQTENNLRGDFGIRFASSSNNGNSTSTNAAFVGSNSASSGVEVFGRIRPNSFSSNIPDNIAVEAYLSTNSNTHEIKFAGASLGKKTCDQALGIAGQWWFGDKKNTVRPYIGIGYESRDCSGNYALGGAKFSQTDMSSSCASLRVGASVDLSDYVAKGLAITGEVKSSCKAETSGTPVAGATVTSKSGGGNQASFGLQYSW